MRRLPVVLALLFAATSLAKPPALEVPYERYRLPNGLVVILHENHALPQVAVNLWYRVGSKDEATRRTGFAHLFEHLMFMGTEAVPNGAFDSIMEAEGGVNNATTSEDRTNYFEFGPSNLLETFLYLEADRLASLPAAMTKAKVDLQRDVVKNERRQSYENRPYGKVELTLPEKLYPKDHPYHHPVIGSHADLTAASVDDVKSFFRQFYTPSNASLVIAGDFDAPQAKKLVEKYFGGLKATPEPKHASPSPVRLEKPERVTLTDQVALPKVVRAWHSPKGFASGDADCHLLAAVLGAGKSSRLYRALVREQKVAQDVQVGQVSNDWGGMFLIDVVAQAGVDAATLEKALDAELARLRTTPVTQAEVDKARAVVELGELDEIASVFGVADMLNAYELAFGDPGQLERSLLARYEQLGPSDLQWQVTEVLGAPAVTVVVVPAKKGADRAR